MKYLTLEIVEQEASAHGVDDLAGEGSSGCSTAFHTTSDDVCSASSIRNGAGAEPANGMASMDPDGTPLMGEAIDAWATFDSTMDSPIIPKVSADAHLSAEDAWATFPADGDGATNADPFGGGFAEPAVQPSLQPDDPFTTALEPGFSLAAELGQIVSEPTRNSDDSDDNIL